MPAWASGEDPSDRAVTIGLQKYREIYPKGAIDTELESRGILCVGIEKDRFLVETIYWLRGHQEPFYFYQASVDRTTGELEVIIARKPDEISVADLQEYDPANAHL